MTPARWRLVEDLYHGACVLPASEWLSYVERNTGGDPALAAEVMSLLRAGGPLARSLETPAIHVIARALAAVDSPTSASLAAGAILSHYRIHEPIGHGGMGVVYKAEDMKLGRLVALKVLPDLLGQDAEARARFEREARAASALNHPNICTVYEIDQAGNLWFIAIEYLEGESLRDCIARGPMVAREIVRVGIDVGAALAAAHESGIIHRDIKPANIFLTNKGVTKVLDFGAAKRMDTAPIETPHQAADDGLQAGSGNPAQSITIGTVAYMSPEQGTGLPADPRSDVYSLGAVLYEMATGRLPAETDALPATTGAAQGRDMGLLTNLDPAIPPELVRIIGTALQSDRAERYQSIVEMRAALVAVQRELNRGIVAWRLPALAAGVVTLLAAVVVVLAVGKTGHGDDDVPAAARPIRSLAVLPFQNATGEPSLDYFADGMTKAIIDDLSRLGTLRIVSSNSSGQYRATQKSAVDVARELKADALVEGSVSRSGGLVQVNAQLIDGESAQHLWHAQYERDVRDVLALQRELAIAVSHEAAGGGQVPVEPRLAARTRTVNPAAYEDFLRAEYFSAKQTPAAFAKADEYYLRSIELDPLFAPAWTGRAESLAYQAYTNRLPPLETWARAEILLTRALELDPDSVLAHTLKGMIALMPHCDRTAAERELSRALELGPGDDTVLTYHSWYLMQTGRTQEAVAEKRKVLEADPVSVNTGSEYGMYLSLAGRQEEAIVQLLHILELDPQFAPALTRLGMAYAAAGQFDLAVRELEKSIAIDENPAALGNLGHVYARWGKSSEALAVVRRLIELSGHRFVSPSLIAKIYATLGDSEQALNWLARAQIGDRPFVNDAAFDGLHSDPRFRTIAAKLRPSAGCALM